MNQAKKIFWGILFSLALALGASAQTSPSQTLLPPAMIQFADGNGAPYAGGQIYFYVPFTTTPKTTYQDPLGQTPNQNPVTLDANGRALIWGSGEYREVLKDSLGNTIFDQFTLAPGLASSGASATCASLSTSGSANAQVLLPPNGVSSLTIGSVYCGIAGFSNTGAMTLKVGTTGAASVEKQTTTGLQALSGGEIVFSQEYLWAWDGTEFQLLNAQPINSYPVLDLVSYGAKGDGTTNNNAAFASAFAAASSGGLLRLPCGTFLITTQISTTIAAGQHVSLQGSGSDCTVIEVEGTENGPTFTLANQWSSVDVRDLTISTDQAGTTSCLVWQTSNANANPALASGNSLTNVTFRGIDQFGANTQYCGNGFYEQSITNIAIVNLTFNGTAAKAGTAMLLQGTSAANSDHINISHSNVDACAIGVFYGDYVQGVQMTLDNFTGCGTGLLTTSSSSTSLSGLLVSSSQFDTTANGISISDAAFPNLQLSNNQFIVEPNSVGVTVQGTNFVIDKSNEFNGHTTTGTVGVQVNSSFGNGGEINGQFIGLATGITVLSASVAEIKIDRPYMLNNTFDYALFGASGTQVDDNYPRSLASINSLLPCTTALRFTRALQADGNSPAYLATATSGGAEVVPLVCNGTNYKNH